MAGFHSSMRHRFVALTVVVLCVFASRISAQPGVTNLTGRVADPQGASLAGAAIVVRHQATDTTWTAATGDDGRFVVSLLPPGDYVVDVFAHYGLDGFHLPFPIGDHFLDVGLAHGLYVG